MPNFELGHLEGTETAAMETFSVENVEYLTSIEGLKPENWSEMQAYERVEATRTLESRLAEIQGRPPMPLVAENMDEGLCGYFDGKVLHINVEYFQNPNYLSEVINTVAHEGRHAYQAYAIEHPGFHPNPQEVQYWAANQQSYIDSRKFGDEYYMNQPMELDAWRYGDMVESIFAESHGSKSWWDSILDSLFAKVENDSQRPSLIARAGNSGDRINSALDSMIP